MAISVINKQYYVESFQYTMSDSICASTEGTINTFSIFFKCFATDIIIIDYLNLRIEDVPAKVLPVVTMKNNDFTRLPAFYTSFPSIERGSAGSAVVSDGGYIQHTAQSDTFTIHFFNYIGEKPAGYIFVTK